MPPQGDGHDRQRLGSPILPVSVYLTTVPSEIADAAIEASRGGKVWRWRRLFDIIFGLVGF